MIEDKDIHHSFNDNSVADTTHDIKDEKLLYNGQVFSSYEDLKSAVERYEGESGFKLCVRGSDLYKGSDHDTTRFPKRRIHYVCQLGQRVRVRLKAETRQRMPKNTVRGKTGCTVKMLVCLVDSDPPEPRYVISKFNREDHNHPPHHKPVIESNLEKPKVEDKVKLCEECGYSTGNARYMRDHVESHHMKKYCPIEGCDFTTMSHVDLTRHMTCSAGHRAVCSICNYVPGRGKTLDDHKCEDHLGK